MKKDSSALTSLARRESVAKLVLLMNLLFKLCFWIEANNESIIQSMRSTLFLLSLTALFVVSCNEVSLPSGDSAALSLNVRTGLDSKSIVEGTTLPSGSQIGLFVADESNDTYDGVPYKNVKYTGTGEADSQVWNTENDIMLSATKATLNAYYPYSEGITNVSAIPVTATIDSQTDWMWAAPVSKLNNKNSYAKINLSHALTVIRLNFIKGSYAGIGNVTSVSVSSEGMATSALLNATDGSLSSINGAGTAYDFSEAFTLSDSKKTFEFITVPTGASAPVSVSVVVNGSDMVAKTSDILLEAGNIYEFTLAISAEGMYLNQVNQKDWNTIDNGTLELAPEELKVPDPFVEWARIQHRDGTLYTAEEWLAAETAGTVTDADANGVAVLYSTVAVCPHVIHPKYTTDEKQWSSNTSVKVPGVTTILDVETARLDVNGQANTDAILTAVVAGTIADAPAAQYCADVTFANGQKGYLPAAGELQAWYDNKTAVNACMNAIGADNVCVRTWYNTWSSTHFSSSLAWHWGYGDSSLSYSTKENLGYARPVSAFEYN